MKLKKQLKKERFEFAVFQLTENAIDISNESNESCIVFYHNEHRVLFYPFSGWHTGKSIKDGRGINKLLKQIKPSKS